MFGERLRTARETAGWSQARLAAETGCATRTVMRAELGQSDPSLATVQAWAEALGVSVADLLDSETGTAA